jgi:hypothetical protein
MPECLNVRRKEITMEDRLVMRKGGAFMSGQLKDGERRNESCPRAAMRGPAKWAVGVLTLLCLLLTCQAAQALTGSLSLFTPYNVPISEVCAGQQYKVLTIIDNQPSDVSVYYESSLDGMTWETLET